MLKAFDADSGTVFNNPMNPTNSKIRTFIAVELPDQARSDIAGLQKDLVSAGLKCRWVKPQNIHLTLKFLGDVDREKVSDIGDGITSLACHLPAFDLRPKGLGCFPGVKNPRVIWTGVSGALDALKTLQTEVEKTLIPFGFKAEHRPFRGHLTIARVKSRLNPRKLAEALRTHSEFSSDIFAVKQVTLFQSVLKPEGPLYTRLCESPLGTPD